MAQSERSRPSQDGASPRGLQDAFKHSDPADDLWSRRVAQCLVACAEMRLRQPYVPRIQRACLTSSQQAYTDDEAWFERAPLAQVHSTPAVQSSPAGDHIARGPRVLSVPRFRLCSFQPSSFRARQSRALNLLLSGCPRHAEFLWREGPCSQPHCSGRTAQRTFYASYTARARLKLCKILRTQ